jgi:hypothetical protein
MSLTYTELESITNDYFMADGKAAVDIYFNAQFLMDYLMNKKKGIFERPNGGKKIRIPLSYDGAEGGFFSRAGTLSSDDRESINAAYFGWKHAYGNATIYGTDELENNDEYGEVSLVTQKLETAQKTCRNKIGKQIYNSALDGAEEITGLLSLCSASTTVAYGGIQEADLVASDGTKPWEGNVTTTSEAISLNVIRTLRTSAKVDDGKQGRPDIGLTTASLFQTINGILQVQQRFTQDTDTVKAGFTHVVFENMIIAEDDEVPSGDFFALNTKTVGFAVHKDGYFVKTPWGDLLVTGTWARTMKILWHGNLVCNNRKANAVHTSLT